MPGVFGELFRYLRNQCLTTANHKRVYRIRKAGGLNLLLPSWRSRIYREYRDLISPYGVSEGWAMDFVSDWIVGPAQKQVRIINIMNEGSRRALWREAYHSISAKTLIKVLVQVVDYRGLPTYIRCDNDPEFISKRLAQWANNNGVELRFIQPGKPSQNGLIERLNKMLRKECLNLIWFQSMDLLNEELRAWSQNYNLVRPHKNLGYKSPEAYEIENQNFYYSVEAAKGKPTCQ